MKKRDFATKLHNGRYTHYTCQSIKTDKLKKKGIQEIGYVFGLQDSEVLSVPESSLHSMGYYPKSDEDAQALIETMLRKL